MFLCMFLFGFRDPVPGSLEGFKQLDISETQRPNPLPGSRLRGLGFGVPGEGGGGGQKKRNKKNVN